MHEFHMCSTTYSFYFTTFLSLSVCLSPGPSVAGLEMVHLLLESVHRVQLIDIYGMYEQLYVDLEKPCKITSTAW